MLGTPAPIRRISSSSRSRVWLVEFDGGPAIVKQAAGPGAGIRYAREMTALRLAGGQRPPVVPEVLAADPAARVMVLEYLTGQGQPAEWMVDYARALARLHAVTVTGGTRALPGAAGPANGRSGTGPATDGTATLPPWRGPTAADARSFLRMAAELDVTIPSSLRDELRRLAERLRPHGRLALLHGDPCPDNAVHTAVGTRFIDLENAALGRGTTELAYLRIGFPTCWCAAAAPESLLRDAEAAYRATWLSLTGSDPPGQLADACAGWLLRGDMLVDRARRRRADYLERVLIEDWRWGTATARQRLLHRLTVVAGLARGTPELASLALVSHTMRERVLRRWPETDALAVTAGNPLRAASQPPP